MEILHAAANAALVTVTAVTLLATAPLQHLSVTAASCPAVTAHRGDAYPYTAQPENSLGAAAAAFSAGAPAVKLDIQFSAPGHGGTDPDGGPVIIHDTTVNRTTLHSGAVSSFSAAALTSMPLLEQPGVPGSVTAQDMPSLTEALGAVKADHGRVIFELHADPLTAVQGAEIAAKLAEAGAYSSDGATGFPGSDWTWVSFNSFIPADLPVIRAAVAATGHTVYTSLLAWTYTAATDGAGMEEVDYAADHDGNAPLTAAQVSALHAAGRLAGTFTPDAAAGWAQAAADGADQVTTDNPAGYLAWCNAGMPS
jgi:glycerophosphoryl diester phosphodiesterase